MQRHPSSHHTVQFFDSRDSKARSISAFVREGFDLNDALFVIMRLEDWNLVAARLPAPEVPLQEMIASGRLTVLDAAPTLARFVRGGRPDRPSFDEMLEDLARPILRRGVRPRIFDDLGDRLAAGGHVTSVVEVEEWTEDFVRKEGIVMLCGYSVEYFGQLSRRDVLRSICRLHCEVRLSPEDPIATALVRSLRNGNPDL